MKRLASALLLLLLPFLAGACSQKAERSRAVAAAVEAVVERVREKLAPGHAAGAVFMPLNRIEEGLLEQEKPFDRKTFAEALPPALAVKLRDAGKHEEYTDSFGGPPGENTVFLVLGRSILSKTVSE